jgi:hypothetical protein
MSHINEKTSIYLEIILKSFVGGSGKIKKKKSKQKFLEKIKFNENHR